MDNNTNKHNKQQEPALNLTSPFKTTKHLTEEKHWTHPVQLRSDPVYGNLPTW